MIKSCYDIVVLDDVARHEKYAIVDGPFGSSLQVKDYVSDGIPVLQGKNISNNKFVWKDVRYITEKKAQELKRSTVIIGDILIIKIGSIGYSAEITHLNGYPYAIIPANLAKVTVDECKINKKFLSLWLNSRYVTDYLKSNASQTAQPALSLTKIKQIPILLPPLETQKKIAAVLDKAQELIDKRKEQLARMDEFVQSVFLEMFGDPVLNGKSWSRIKLKEIAKVKIGPFGSSLHVEDYVKGGIPLVNPSHIVKGEILVDKKMTISAKKASELAAYRMKSGDVVLGRRGEIGRCAVVKEREDGFLCGTGSMFIALTEVLSPVYLAYLLSSTTMRAVLENNAKGITMKNLNAGVVENININLPPVDLQNQFAAIVAKTEQQKSLMQQSLTEMKNNMNSLMQRAFKGELW